MRAIAERSRNTEIKLINSLRRFDRNIYFDYCDKATALYDEIKSKNKNVRWISKPEGPPDLFFIDFSYPIYLLLSHPISRYKKNPHYWISQGEASICLDQALVPAYFFTYNTYTVVRLWNDAAQRFFSPTAEPLSETLEYWAFSPKQENAKGAYISSLNFLLKDRTKMKYAPKKIHEIIEKNFKYLFWSFPNQGYSSNSHFIYNQEHITTFFKITKSIMSIYLNEYDDVLEFGSNTMNIVRIGISCLVLNDLEPEWITMHPILTKNVFEDLSEIDTDNFFINGIVSEFRRRSGTKINTINIIAKYGYSHIELLNSIIGMVSWNIYIKNHHLTYVGTKEVVESYVNKILKFMSERINIERTVSDIIENKYNYAFSELYPNIVNINNEIHVVNPIIFSILEKNRLLNKILGDKNAFINLISLINYYSDKSYKEVITNNLYREVLNVVKFRIKLDSLLNEIKTNIIFMKKYHNYMILDDPKIMNKNYDESDDNIPIIRKKQNARKQIVIHNENVCPTCLGIGHIVSVRYHREDGSIQQVAEPIICRTCNGTGKFQTSV